MELKKPDAREQRFVDEYLIDLDPKRAALAAGYAKTTAAVKSYGWVSKSESTKPHVLAAINEAMAARSERTKINADWVLERLGRLAAATMADFLVIPDKGMPYFDLSAATPEQLAAIEGLQLDTRLERSEKGDDNVVIEKIKLTLPGKLKTLELIGKHVAVQAFSERREIGGIGGGPLRVEDVTTTEAARRIAFILAKAAKD